MTESDWTRLKAAAKEAATHAYAPYSRFPVGAAAMAEDGTVFAACNVENASYGLTVCAERAALFAMVASGRKVVRALALFTPTPGPVSPCGACRQVLAEFIPPGAACPVLLSCDGGADVLTEAAELLPHQFRLDSRQ
ncbi:MAG: cytidine deaminase [Fimbriimonadaceae bacterium]|nr:cytidine deaminase [Fimbriimonadaceae bacterium]QYK55726.1 MAG: cytidine deaminase [Fimbriimonadaceae bacterium]